MKTMLQGFLGNSAESWMASFISFVLIYVVIGVLGRFILLRLIRTRLARGQVVTELLESLVKHTNLIFLFLLALFIGSRTLILPPALNRFLEILAVIALVLQFVFWASAALDFWIKRRVKAKPEEEAVNATTYGAVSLMVKIALWSLATLIILQNITQMDLNALIAALGIGGVAVALAVQNILGDLFSSISISMDKPFVLGDFIAVDDMRGTVEYIGLKSTRLRSINGEQLIFSNSDLLSSRVQNFQRLQRRRVAFNVNVAYQTLTEKLTAIPKILQECVETQAQVTFAQAYFKEFGSYALVFECAYFVEGPDFQVHMKALQAINLEIHRRFKEQGIELAFLGMPPSPASNPLR
jgi:small-conductance mechanosensitive channel